MQSNGYSRFDERNISRNDTSYGMSISAWEIPLMRVRWNGRISPGLGRGLLYWEIIESISRARRGALTQIFENAALVKTTNLFRIFVQTTRWRWLWIPEWLRDSRHSFRVELPLNQVRMNETERNINYADDGNRAIVAPHMARPTHINIETRRYDDARRPNRTIPFLDRIIKRPT